MSTYARATIRWQLSPISISAYNFDKESNIRIRYPCVTFFCLCILKVDALSRDVVHASLHENLWSTAVLEDGQWNAKNTFLSINAKRRQKSILLIIIIWYDFRALLISLSEHLYISKKTILIESHSYSVVAWISSPWHSEHMIQIKKTSFATYWKDQLLLLRISESNQIFKFSHLFNSFKIYIFGIHNFVFL